MDYTGWSWRKIPIDGNKCCHPRGWDAIKRRHKGQTRTVNCSRTDGRIPHVDSVGGDPAGGGLGCGKTEKVKGGQEIGAGPPDATPGLTTIKHQTSPTRPDTTPLWGG